MSNYEEICIEAIDNAESVTSGASKEFIEYRQEFNAAVLTAKSVYKILSNRSIANPVDNNAFSNANSALLSISHRFNCTDIKNSGVTEDEAKILSMDAVRAGNISRIGISILQTM